MVATRLLRVCYSSVDNMLDVPLQSPSKVLEHGGSPREYDVLFQESNQTQSNHRTRETHLVQAPPHIDRTRLNHIIHHFRQRRQEIRTVDLGIEEDLRRKEPLVADINIVFPARDAMFAGKSRKVLVRIGIVFANFLDDVLTDVGVVFLDLFGAEKTNVRISMGG